MVRELIALIFRGEDPEGNVVALFGQGKQLRTDEPQPAILSYVLDSNAPDIFEIEKGDL